MHTNVKPSLGNSLDLPNLKTEVQTMKLNYIWCLKLIYYIIFIMQVLNVVYSGKHNGALQSNSKAAFLKEKCRSTQPLCCW